MPTDPSWLYSTIAQSSAAIVAIIGGFITATVLMLTAEKRSLDNQLIEKKVRLEKLIIERDTRDVRLNLAEELKLPAFENRLAYEIYDDHVPLWEFAQIPTVDLIDFEYPNQRTNYWHTHNDIPQNCSAESLAQVGTLLANFIYSQEL